MNRKNLQNKSQMVLLILVSIAFVWILLPFYGAVFWAVILGIVFAPLQRRLQFKLNWPRNLTTLLTLAICTLIAILPVIVISTLLVQEGAALYKSLESGELDVADYLARFKDALPPYFQHLLDRFGLGDRKSTRLNSSHS